MTAQDLIDYLERHRYNMPETSSRKEVSKAFASMTGVDFLLSLVRDGCNPLDVMFGFQLGIHFMQELEEIEKLEKSVPAE